MEEKVEAKNRRSSCKGSKVQSIQGDHPQQSMLDGPPLLTKATFLSSASSSQLPLLNYCFPVTRPVSAPAAPTGPLSKCCLLPPLCPHPLLSLVCSWKVLEFSRSRP